MESRRIIHHYRILYLYMWWIFFMVVVINYSIFKLTYNVYFVSGLFSYTDSIWYVFDHIMMKPKTNMKLCPNHLERNKNRVREIPKLKMFRYIIVVKVNLRFLIKIKNWRIKCERWWLMVFAVELVQSQQFHINTIRAK